MKILTKFFRCILPELAIELGSYKKTEDEEREEKERKEEEGKQDELEWFRKGRPAEDIGITNETKRRKLEGNRKEVKKYMGNETGPHTQSGVDKDKTSKNQKNHKINKIQKIIKSRKPK